MQVFIENEAGSNLKHIYNEKTFEYIKTIKVSRKYPFPYGFILNTTGEDGDNIDAFVLTNKALKRGQVVECNVLGLMEQFEQSWGANKEKEEVDHNVLMILAEDQLEIIEESVKMKLTAFVTHVFDDIQLNKTRVGEFLNKASAILYIEANRDK